MTGSNILLSVGLNALRDFLRHSCRWVDVEQNEDGELDERDFDKLLYRQTVAARAAYYEINALVESEIYEAASKPWHASNHEGPKTLSEWATSGSELKSLRMVEDLKIKDAIRLIEKGYQIKLSDLPRYSEIFQVREAVNAFKHRQGFVDFRKHPPEQTKLLERHRVDIDAAEAAIGYAKEFVLALRKVTNRSW